MSLQMALGALTALFLLVYLVAVLMEQTREAQRTLGESERRFRAVANSAPIMIWMCGVDRGCEFVNQRWLAFTGRTLEQELGNGWLQSVHPEDVHRCEDVCGASFESREPFEMEYRVRRRDGEYRWVLDRGTPRHGTGGEQHTRDQLTPRHRAPPGSRPCDDASSASARRSSAGTSSGRRRRDRASPARA